MRKLFIIIIVAYLLTFIVCSAFVFPELQYERQRWALLFFDSVALLELSIFWYILKTERE